MAPKRSSSSTPGSCQKLRRREDGTPEELEVSATDRQSASENTEPASARVMKITELVEKIVLQLPTQDLLLSQRVCKQWRALALMSPSIRRALFLEPIAPVAISYLDWHLDDIGAYKSARIDLNLGAPISSMGKPPRRYKAHWGVTREDAGKYSVFLNPLLAKVCPWLRSDGMYDPSWLSNMAPGMRNRNASWRHMFPCQPPMRSMVMEEGLFGGRHVAGTPAKPDSDDLKPMIMEDLMDALRSIRTPIWISGTEEWLDWKGAESQEIIEAECGIVRSPPKKAHRLTARPAVSN